MAIECFGEIENCNYVMVVLISPISETFKMVRNSIGTSNPKIELRTSDSFVAILNLVK